MNNDLGIQSLAQVQWPVVVQPESPKIDLEAQEKIYGKGAKRWQMDVTLDETNAILWNKNKTGGGMFYKVGPAKQADYKIKNSICLVMIVRNESKIIERMLDSVKDIIDYWVIVDTHSTDKTRELIIEYCTKHKIPGELYLTDFIDFGTARSISVQLAYNKADYLLLSDADYVWKELVPNWKVNAKLNPLVDEFMIMTEGSDNRYARPHLIVGRRIKYAYRQRTHEHLTPSNSKQEKTNVVTGWMDLFSNDAKHREKSIKIGKNKRMGNTVREDFPYLILEHVADGGSKGDKFHRDIRLLHMDINDEPDNTRCHYYLGNSYKNIGDLKNSYIYHEKRALMGDWTEEAYFAMQESSLIQKQVGLSARFWIAASLRGWMYDAYRLESMSEILFECEKRDLHHLGASLGTLCLLNDYPEEKQLFVNQITHERTFWMNLLKCTNAVPWYLPASLYIIDSHFGENRKDSLKFSKLSRPDLTKKEMEQDLKIITESETAAKTLDKSHIILNAVDLTRVLDSTVDQPFTVVAELVNYGLQQSSPISLFTSKTKFESSLARKEKQIKESRLFGYKYCLPTIAPVEVKPEQETEKEKEKPKGEKELKEKEEIHHLLIKALKAKPKIKPSKKPVLKQVASLTDQLRSKLALLMATELQKRTHIDLLQVLPFVIDAIKLDPNNTEAWKTLAAAPANLDPLKSIVQQMLSVVLL